MIEISKYDIVYIKEQGSGRGSVQMYARPAIVLQNNMGNHFSTTTIVALITSSVKRIDLPTHVVLTDYELSRRSMVLLEQIMTISKEDIINKIDHLRVKDQKKVDRAMRVSLGLTDEAGCVEADRA